MVCLSMCVCYTSVLVYCHVIRNFNNKIGCFALTVFSLFHDKYDHLHPRTPRGDSACYKTPGTIS